VVTVNRLRLGTNPVIDWLAYKHLLADQVIQERLRSLTAEVIEQGSPGFVILDPPLKVLDVLLWMSTMKSSNRPRR
jgi:hypothetical protein